MREYVGYKVKAVQWKGSNIEEIKKELSSIRVLDKDDGTLLLDHHQPVNISDYIVVYAMGKVTVLTEDDFWSTYEEVR
jgi:DNA-directed RNA polymerase subunit F